MALVGYARVSSVGQSLAVQREKLAACDRIFEETRSGTVDTRPRLAACLDYVRDGDTLVVTRLDRLARSTLHLCQIADQLRQKGVALRVLDQAIDTSDATGRLVFHMLGAIAQFETEIRAERQLDGIANARARGVPLGRQHALTSDQIAELRARRAQGVLVKTLMTEYGLGRSTIYRYLDGVTPGLPAQDLIGDPPQSGHERPFSQERVGETEPCYDSGGRVVGMPAQALPTTHRGPSS